MTVNPHHDQCPIPPDRRTILKQWQGLKNDESLDHQQLAQLIDVEGNRNVALKFGGKDAATVINTIDKVSQISWDDASSATMADIYCPFSLRSQGAKSN
jgi:hypothetical protein